MVYYEDYLQWQTNAIFINLKILWNYVVTKRSNTIKSIKCMSPIPFTWVSVVKMKKLIDFDVILYTLLYLVWIWDAVKYWVLHITTSLIVIKPSRVIYFILHSYVGFDMQIVVFNNSFQSVYHVTEA